MRRAAVAWVTVCALSLWAPGRAQACATCQCGDPTLTTMGNEQPFAGRFRLSGQLLHRTNAVGEPRVTRTELAEQRLDLGVSYAPTDWLFLAATLPLVRREVTHVNLARDELLGVGDVDVRAKAFLYQDRIFAPRHLLAVTAGVELPTAPISRDATGAPLPIDVQAGSGSFDPLVGVAYSHFAAPWSLYASATVVIGTEGTAGFRPGTSLRTTVAGQLQPSESLAVGLGVDTRLDGQTLEGGEPEPDTGGFIAFASPQLAYSPAMDLILHAILRVPFWNALNGRHDEGLIVSVGATYDL